MLKVIEKKISWKQSKSIFSFYVQTGRNWDFTLSVCEALVVDVNSAYVLWYWGIFVLTFTDVNESFWN